MEKNILEKLNNSSGESFSEVLVASLVISLGMILLVTMINTSTHIIHRSDLAFDKYYEAKNNYNLGNIHSGGTSSVTVRTKKEDLWGIATITIPVTVDYATSSDGTYSFATYEYKK